MVVAKQHKKHAVCVQTFPRIFLLNRTRFTDNGHHFNKQFQFNNTYSIATVQHNLNN